MSRAKKDSRLKRAGVSGYNKPKRTPNHPKKSHVVVAKKGDKVKTIRFGQQGVKGAGKNPKTKKEFIIKDRKVVTFYPSLIIKRKINEKKEQIGL